MLSVYDNQFESFTCLMVSFFHRHCFTQHWTWKVW